MVSAIESDIRDFIAAKAGSRISELLVGDVTAKATRRLADALSSAEVTSGDAPTLLDFCDFADLATALRQLDAKGMGSGAEVELAKAIEQVSPARNRVCHSRPLEAEDFPSIVDLSDRLLSERDGVSPRHVRETRARLQADPASVFQLEIPDYWGDRGSRPNHNLPVPEFDDTGFLGRKKDRDSLTRLILSAHPVVTVVGEGGVGKTALVLSCLYDLVAKGESQPFDAIVWISLKTTALVFGGTQDVRNSVVDVLGLLRRASTNLGNPDAASATADDLHREILDYMEAFRILLVIDNLETLTVGTLRSLLLDLPEGSKILLTSRVPLGEFEVRYALDRLDDNTARLLARRYATLLNVGSIANATEKELGEYVDAMFGNPLLIKWFVGAVSAGEDPTRLISLRPSAFDQAVAFCFQNLFDLLAPLEQEVLYTIAAARRPLSRGELILLLRRPVPEVDGALVALSNSSMVRRPSSRQGQAYSLTPIAAAFIERLRPPSSELVQHVTQSLVKIRHMAQSDQVARAGDQYDPATFEWKTRDDLIATAMLRAAIEAERREDYEEALRHVRRAEVIAPTWSEVFRVEAQVRGSSGDVYRAGEAYERALALAPASARLNYFYGLFLLHKVEDYSEALRVLTKAETLDPDFASATLAVATVLKRLGLYKEASERYEQLLKELDDIPWKFHLVIVDGAVDCYRRWMEQDSKHQERTLFAQHFTRAWQLLMAAAADDEFDTRLRARLSDVLDECALYARSSRNDAIAEQLVTAIETWPAEETLSIEKWAKEGKQSSRFASAFPRLWATASKVFPALEELVPTEEGEPEVGVVAVLRAGFGFVKAQKGDTLYFSARECLPQSAFRTFRVGSPVSFHRGANEKGACAITLRALSNNVPDEGA